MPLARGGGLKTPTAIDRRPVLLGSWTAVAEEKRDGRPRTGPGEPQKRPRRDPGYHYYNDDADDANDYHGDDDDADDVFDDDDAMTVVTMRMTMLIMIMMMTK